MAEYSKHIWTDGEVITAEKLNNLETGIAEANKNNETHGINSNNPHGVTAEQTGAARIVTAHYAGNGKYTVQNMNYWNLPFLPKMVIVTRTGTDGLDSMLLTYDNAVAWSTKGGPLFVVWDATKNRVSWASHESAEIQMNALDEVYHCIAIG